MSCRYPSLIRFPSDFAMSSYLTDIAAIFCTLVCIRLLQSWGRRRNKLPLPPGPKGRPVIGNALDMPETEPWEAARKWGEIYGMDFSESYLHRWMNLALLGPVVHLDIFGTSFVFLNTYEAAVDLFEKRGAKYSSRPRITMMELHVS